MRPPDPSFSAGNTVPVSGGPFTPQQPQAPMYPTDRAPNLPAYGPNPGPAAFGAPPAPPVYPVPPPSYGQQAYGVAPAVKKSGGGVGIVVAALLVLLLLGGAAAVAVVGYQRGWFSSAGSTNGNANTNTSLPPDTASAEELFQQGYQLQTKNDRQGAILKYRAALAKDPKLTKAHRNLGAALVDTKQYRDAIKELESALEQDPTPNDQVYYNLGLAHFKLKEYSQAGDFFKRSASAGTDPEAHALAGFALDNANDEADATSEYKLYLKTSPTGTYADLVKGILSGTQDVPSADEFDF